MPNTPSRREGFFRADYLNTKLDTPRHLSLAAPAYPVDSKVLTPGAVGKRGPDKVVDSKKMTPAKERNADESKDSRRGVAAIEATVCREEPGRAIPID
jgi:hypothetical protein